MPIIDCHVHLNYYYHDTDMNNTKHFLCLEDRLKVLLESMDYNDNDTILLYYRHIESTNIDLLLLKLLK
jgi:hypothetical protein